MLTHAEIEAARRRLTGVAIRTPVLTSRQFDAQSGAKVFFKAENLQRGGAFKFRGAYNKLKAATEAGKVANVVAYSSGNHGQAVALVSKLLGLKAAIVMPKDAPAAKLAATRAYGAEIVPYDRYTEDRVAIGQRLVRERGAVLVPPFDDELVMAGQGTAAAELVEEVPDLEILLAPVSGGGLMAGTAVAARHAAPSIILYGVEPAAGNDTAQSFAKGERVTIPIPETIADALRLPQPGEQTFPILKKTLAGVLLVSDVEITETLFWMLERMKILAEPSGVVGAAAVRHKKADFTGRRVGVIVSGGNVDLGSLAQLYRASAGA